ncbi:hypothetical protein PGT21_004099 [Puccinia graminis f. sp. tritici]|uniref:Hydrophobin n=1 Tax=Puccinia graminis f. sp. tritici TaxID=56615 RepID=A0A5B0PDF9_PUCGR|nr:hypothetical protein PGT21_004099 [Puccinia graminis f. sp. tritici]
MKLSNVFSISSVFLLQGAVTYVQGFGCKDNSDVPNWPISGCVKMVGMKKELAEVIPAHWIDAASTYDCASDQNRFITEACCAHVEDTQQQLPSATFINNCRKLDGTQFTWPLPVV